MQIDDMIFDEDDHVDWEIICGKYIGCVKRAIVKSPAEESIMYAWRTAKK